MSNNIKTKKLIQQQLNLGVLSSYINKNNKKNDNNQSVTNIYYIENIHI
jgi:hypothetical protein